MRYPLDIEHNSYMTVPRCEGNGKDGEHCTNAALYACEICGREMCRGHKRWLVITETLDFDYNVAVEQHGRIVCRLCAERLFLSGW